VPIDQELGEGVGTEVVHSGVLAPAGRRDQPHLAGIDPLLHLGQWDEVLREACGGVADVLGDAL
jgi:hypothetical protein